MTPDLALKFEARACDAVDSELATAYHSGELTLDSYKKHPKYILESIVSIIILPNSLCQIGLTWARHIPFVTQSKFSPKSTDNLSLLSIACLLNQAVQVSASLSSNSIVDVLKPDVFVSSVARASSPNQILTGSSDSPRKTVPKYAQKLDLYSDPTGFVPRPFDFNAAVATYIDFLPDYPEDSLPSTKKLKLVTTPSPAQPPLDRNLKRETRRYPVGYKKPLPLSSDGFWDDFSSDIPIGHLELFVSTALEVFIAYRSIGIPFDRSLDLTKTPVELTRERLEFLKTVMDEQFVFMSDQTKALCNLSLWVIGSRISKIPENQLSRILSDYGIDDSIRTRFHQAFKVGRIVSSLWSSDIPIDRMGNIKCDLYTNLSELNSNAHDALVKALHALKMGW
ncbi:hypothetical protein DSO57_1005658 [Entomophthora muscae]|uniref:Uncharacterized protein n=1 Tax=Entomophthora muscae TaxID=34485 RepID=A0ACC2RYR6_9FUNG|nr:hypothetical protein DSO57_1005658 [Entomophthora muscae]